MTTPHKLDRMIDDHLNEKPITLDSDEMILTAELLTLANSFTLDPQFDSALAGQFKTSTVIPITTRRRFGWQKIVAAVATILFGLVVMTLTVPQFRAFAQEIIDDLFPPDAENQRTLDTFQFEEGDIQRFYTIEELQNNVDFEVKVPDLAGTVYEFVFANIVLSANTTSISYTNQSDESPILGIKQQPLADSISNGVFWLSTEMNTVGEEAEVVQVQIGDYVGAFVQGEWTTSDRSNDPAKIFFWNDDFPIYRLRWQDEEFLYEIRLVSRDFSEILPQHLVAIAESMMGE